MYKRILLLGCSFMCGSYVQAADSETAEQRTFRERPFKEAASTQQWFDAFRSDSKVDFAGLDAILEDFPSAIDVEVNERKDTALMFAAKSFNVPMVNFLLSRGANPTAVNVVGDTALHYAVDRINSDDQLQKSAEIVALLLAKKLDPNVQNKRRKTPLMIAVDEDAIDSARLLLEHKADPLLTDDLGRSALTIARSPEMRKLLAEYTGAAAVAPAAAAAAR
ncbi:MAG TPA: ankyrin repeat domain-containing protein [Candidatus Limnocylindria bacterium]|nr:ankyrin repeat domain-containing protein [Candidatus Limnocylindria bacterium]